MKKNYIAFVALFMSACGDVEPVWFDPKDASQVEGFWHRDLQPNWTLHCSNGLCEQSVFDFNTVIVENKWAYWTRRDTMFLFSPEDRDTLRWQVLFCGADTFETVDIDKAHALRHRYIRFK